MRQELIDSYIRLTKLWRNLNGQIGSAIITLDSLKQRAREADKQAASTQATMTKTELSEAEKILSKEWEEVCRRAEAEGPDDSV